jgi:hypothetical protein
MKVPGAASGPGFLLMRRAGSLWGIANAAVTGLERRADGAYGIATGERQAEPVLLVADEVVGVVAELRLWPSPLIRRFWPEPFRGLSVHGALPLVVVDPGSPPRALRPEGEEVGETEGRE